MMFQIEANEKYERFKAKRMKEDEKWNIEN